MGKRRHYHILPSTKTITENYKIEALKANYKHKASAFDNKTIIDKSQTHSLVLRKLHPGCYISNINGILNEKSEWKFKWQQ